MLNIAVLDNIIVETILFSGYFNGQKVQKNIIYFKYKSFVIIKMYLLSL